MTRSSWSESLSEPVPRIGFVRFDFDRLKVPGRLPVLVIVTEPVAVPPGFMPEAVRMAEPFLEFVWLRLPELNVFAGLAVAEVKSAPEPTTSPTDASDTASAPSVSFGHCKRMAIRDMAGSDLIAKPPGATPAESIGGCERARGPSCSRSSIDGCRLRLEQNMR